jgi:hypothetical protein
MDWINLVHDRDRWRALTSTVMNLGIPYNEENLTSRGTVSFSRKTLLYGMG